MSAQIDDKVDDVDVETAWKVLQSSPRSQLVDVRTRAEWSYVGIPDLGPVAARKRTGAGTPAIAISILPGRR